MRSQANIKPTKSYIVTKNSSSNDLNEALNFAMLLQLHLLQSEFRPTNPSGQKTCKVVTKTKTSKHRLFQRPSTSTQQSDVAMAPKQRWIQPSPVGNVKQRQVQRSKQSSPNEPRSLDDILKNFSTKSLHKQQNYQIKARPDQREGLPLEYTKRQPFNCSSSISACGILEPSSYIDIPHTSLGLPTLSTMATGYQLRKEDNFKIRPSQKPYQPVETLYDSVKYSQAKPSHPPFARPAEQPHLLDQSSSSVALPNFGKSGFKFYDYTTEKPVSEFNMGNQSMYESPSRPFKMPSPVKTSVTPEKKVKHRLKNLQPRRDQTSRSSEQMDSNYRKTPKQKGHPTVFKYQRPKVRSKPQVPDCQKRTEQQHQYLRPITQSPTQPQLRYKYAKGKVCKSPRQRSQEQSYFDSDFKQTLSEVQSSKTKPRYIQVNLSQLQHSSRSSSSEEETCKDFQTMPRKNQPRKSPVPRMPR